MADTPTSTTPLARVLKEKAQQGREARRALGQKLASLTAQELAKLPRGVLERIGPEGISSALDSVAAGYRDSLRPTPCPTASVNVAEKKRKGWPALLTAVVSVAALCTIPVLVDVVERPAKWAISHVGLTTPEAIGLCRRPDPWSGDCQRFAAPEPPHEMTW